MASAVGNSSESPAGTHRRESVEQIHREVRWDDGLRVVHTDTLFVSARAAHAHPVWFSGEFSVLGLGALREDLHGYLVGSLRVARRARFRDAVGVRASRHRVLS